MNIQENPPPTTIREGMLAMHPHDIKEFFDKLRLSETKMLGNLPIERLTAMQERVKLLNELEHYVSTLPEAIKTKPRK